MKDMRPGYIHAICMNIGLYMNAGEAQIKNRVDSPQSEAMGRVRPYRSGQVKNEKNNT